MAFRSFTLNVLESTFGLVENYEVFTQNFQPVAPSSWLLETLEIGHQVAFVSEKSRSETIVMPILLEIQRKQPKSTFGIYSGVLLDVDKDLGLKAECDFIMALGKQSIELKTPVFCMVEAKDNDIEIGIPQCFAQMVSVRMLNKAVERQPTNIYGCVTTGTEWQFLYLKDNEMIIDDKRYYLDRLENILGVLQWIIDSVLKEVNK